jgi:hypothetical protein
MTRTIPLPRTARHVSILLLLAVSNALTACGGGGSSAGPTAPPPPSGGSQPPAQAPVEGVATPTSVAVVTATNAQ